MQVKFLVISNVDKFLFSKSKLVLIPDIFKDLFFSSGLRLFCRGGASYRLSTDFQLSTRRFNSCENHNISVDYTYNRPMNELFSVGFPTRNKLEKDFYYSRFFYGVTKSSVSCWHCFSKNYSVINF